MMMTGDSYCYNSIKMILCYGSYQNVKRGVHMKKRVKAMALVCVMAIISCKADVYAAKQTKLETIRVIKEIKGDCKMTVDKNEISALKWTNAKPEELQHDLRSVYKYNKYGLVKKIDNQNSICEYKYDKNKMISMHWQYKNFQREEIKKEFSGWIYNKEGKVVKYNMGGVVSKRYIYSKTGKKKILKKIKFEDGYKEYNYNEKRQVSSVHYINNMSAKYLWDSISMYIYDECGNIVSQVNEHDGHSWVEGRTNFQYDPMGYPVYYEYGYYDSDSDQGPDIQIWFIGNNTIEYKDIKVPKNCIKIIKQQQWEIINDLYTEDMFYDVLTPYLYF